VTLTTAGLLSYANGESRCIQMTREEYAEISGHLAAVRDYLDRVDAMQYGKMYRDAPHLVVLIDGRSVFVPLVLTLSEPLSSALAPLDELLRRNFGRGYAYPLLPTESERDDLKKMMPGVSIDGP